MRRGAVVARGRPAGRCPIRGRPLRVRGRRHVPNGFNGGGDGRAAGSGWGVPTRGGPVGSRPLLRAG